MKRRVGQLTLIYAHSYSYPPGNIHERTLRTRTPNMTLMPIATHVSVCIFEQKIHRARYAIHDFSDRSELSAAAALARASSRPSRTLCRCGSSSSPDGPREKNDGPGSRPAAHASSRTRPCPTRFLGQPSDAEPARHAVCLSEDAQQASCLPSSLLRPNVSIVNVPHGLLVRLASAGCND